MQQITYHQVKASEEIKTYIQEADLSLQALGYTEHSFAHVTKCAKVASELLRELGYGERTCELAAIAAYMHDIGNVVNRIDHAQSGAVMAFRILDKMGMNAKELATVVTAIGNHDEKTAFPVNEVAAALILADKTDVRRSRVRSKEDIQTDIHDRVNYAVHHSTTILNLEKRTFTLQLELDTNVCPILEYFEIFMERMLLCRRAGAYFDLTFEVIINNQKLM